MKKFITILIIGVLVLILTGCGVTEKLISEGDSTKEEVKAPISQSVEGSKVALGVFASDTYVMCIDEFAAIPGSIVEVYSGSSNEGFNPESERYLVTSLTVVENGTFAALNIGNDSMIDVIYLVQRENGKRSSAPVILFK